MNINNANGISPEASAAENPAYDIENIKKRLRSVMAGVKENEAMSGHTTFKVGGPADIFLDPAGEEELQAAVSILKEAGLPFVVLGNGSNVLIRDGGIRGAVICLGRGFDRISVEEEKGLVSAGAGALMSSVARAAADHSLTGLEFASGIPGSLGGGVFMNAGAYGGELSQAVVSVRALMPDGKIASFGAESLDMSYRHSIFSDNGGIILSADLQLKSGDPELIKETMKDLNRRRTEKQPLNYPSAGSTFKRPKGHFAGKLIQDAGCMGLTVGGAQVSLKHAGFVINKGGATARDILDLIKLVQMRVGEMFGVSLEPEVRIMGSDPLQEGRPAGTGGRQPQKEE